MNFQELEQLPFHFWDTGDQLKNHVYDRSQVLFGANDAQRDKVRSLSALHARQAALRAYLIQCIGGLPDLTTPLDTVITGAVQGQGFRIEKLVFQSRPRHYVTANLYLPEGLSGPSGAVLFLCGHLDAAKQDDEYQVVCQILAQSGLIVLAQDPIGQGERIDYYDPASGKTLIAPCWTAHDHAGEPCRMLGWSLARYFLHDSMRAVDYLVSRPEVDASKIGVTGNSGGGTQTCLLMMADCRIAAAAPATFIMSREIMQLTGMLQDAEQIWPGFTSAGYDHEDVLLAMAPKPVCVQAVRSDFFPIEATRRTVERSRPLWEMCGQSHALEYIEEDGTHHYTPSMARAAARFFVRHLNGRDATLFEVDALPLPKEQLQCTFSGQVNMEFADALIVHDCVLDELSRARDDKDRSAGKAEAIEWLRQRVYSHRQPCDLNPRFYGDGQIDNLQIEMAFWWSQPELLNAGYLFRSKACDGRDLPVTIALWKDGTHSLQTHADWIKSVCATDRAVLVTDISGLGVMTPNAITYPRNDLQGTFHKLADDLVWIDDSLAALRIYDLLRVLAMLRVWPGLQKRDTQIYAPGRMGIYARLSALLEPGLNISKPPQVVETICEIASQRYYNRRDIKSFVIPGIARYETALLQ